ncbi:MAG TPA: extracellular solute-binding protein [Chloroflexota bacterium]|nr:extracellular solute-binding protein [Chloroflexota bacterium]
MSVLYRPFSRRAVLSTALGLLGAAAAACGPAAAPTEPPKPAAPAPTTAPAATAAPAATTAPAAAPAAPTKPVEPTKPAAEAAKPTEAPKPTTAPAAAAPRPEGTRPAATATLSFTNFSLFASWPPFSGTLMAKEWQSATGVNIDWRPIPSTQIAEKVTVMLSTGELTDMYPLSPPNLRQMGPATSLPLDDLLAQHAPNYSRFLKEHEQDAPQIRAPNGKLYGMFGWREYIYQGWIYRRDLAEKLGFKQIGGPDATVEDWYNFLKAAKKEDPQRHGFGNQLNVLWLALNLRGAYGIKGQVTPGEWYTERDGKIRDGSILPEAKDLIAAMRRFYTEGLIDPEMITNVEEQASKDRWIQGKTIATFAEYLNRHDIFAGKLDVAPAVPPKGPKGDRAETPQFFGWAAWPGGIAFNTKLKDPAPAIRFVDHMFSDDGVKLYYLGKEGETYQKAGDSFQLTQKVKDQVDQSLKEKKEGVDRPDRVIQYYWGLHGYSFPIKVLPGPPNVWNAYVGLIETKAVVDAQNLGKPYQAKSIPNPVFNDAETDELKRLTADIKTYRDETFTGMIGGKIAMDQWDAYVAQMKKLGAQRVEEIYNTASQRTFKR